MSPARTRQLAGFSRLNRASVAIAFATALAFAFSAPPQPRTRTFHLQYTAIVQAIPTGAQHVDLWVPVPHSDDYQKIDNLQIDSPFPYEITTSEHGNTMVHVGVDRPQEPTFSIVMSLDATRKEHIQARLFGGPPPAHDEDPAELAQYLQPDRLVPIDGQIRAWAREVVAQANAHTDLEMARAIYNHVVATVKYDKSGKGWGRGDIYYACEERRGNCTDFHAIFIGYSRAMGIPARFAIGVPLPPTRGEGRIQGYHCWAEFYAKGIGWVPVDASEAAKNPAKREYFFGAHDENRLEFSKGRDIVLMPRQKAEPLNYFVYPYAESDGKPLAQTAYAISYRDTGAPQPASVP